VITTRIIGGLGNQLFQYACGRALSERYKVPHQLDLRGFQQYKLHQYQLDKFCITAQVGAARDLPKFYRFGPLTFTRYAHRKGQLKNSVVREAKLAFDTSIYSHGSNLYLDGYWQSERYFADIRNTLVQELQLREPLDAVNQRLAEEMQQQNSVSLHVRRADYVNNPTYAECTVDYYHRALTMIAEREKNLHVYVFSDDIPWVQEHIHLAVPTTYVTQNNGRANYLDIVLMRFCTNSIIANSSFSWWGAWLKKNVTGLVIAPKTWYTDPRKASQDLLPHRWVTIPN
jgi:hypothetical protein